MASDHMVYLSSMGCMKMYPRNKPCKFVNRLSTPIILDNDIDYEVGLVSIMYPIQYYAITSGDERFCIYIHTRYSVNENPITYKYEYTAK